MAFEGDDQRSFDGGSAPLYDRMPPQDKDAEMSVLGAMLMSKEAIAEVEGIVQPDDFYFPNHREIFEAIHGLFTAMAPADPVTVADALRSKGKLSQIGGQEYLVSVLSTVPTAASAAYYARIVADLALMRRMIDAGTRIVQLGYADDGGDVDDLIGTAQREVLALTASSNKQDYVRLGDSVKETIRKIDEGEIGRQGIPTGFRDLDELTNGLHGGQMIIVAGRPAMGKSTLALDFCRYAALHEGKTAAIFSLEMSREDIARRMLAAESQVKLSSLNKGTVEDSDWQKILNSMDRITDAPLFIDDSPNLTMSEIAAKARRLKQQENLSILAVDYLQLMSSGKRVESRQQEVSEFSRSLKLLAKELDIPVIAAAQLNRGPEQRNDRKPMIADLRESGSLEQDADIIMLLHRPNYYNKDDRPGEADIIVAKHRNGETRVISVAFQGHYARFTNKAEEITPGGHSGGNAGGNPGGNGSTPADSQGGAAF